MSTLFVSRTTTTIRSYPPRERLRAWLDRLIATDDSLAPALARVTLGGVMLSHVLQRGPEWFAAIGVVGALLLVTGAFARVGALLVATALTVVVMTLGLPLGSAVSWYAQNTTERLEYYALVTGLAAVTLVAGAGKWSVDRAWWKDSWSAWR